MAPKSPPPKFDQSKFQQMQEPFTVRVERLDGNRKEPIPLPAKDGYSVGGPGWTSDEIMALEQWIVKEWSGGGTYLFQVTDTANATMEWTAVFNYPRKVPPIMQDQGGGGPPPLMQGQQPQQIQGAGYGSPFPWPPAPAQPWQTYAPPAPSPWAAMYGTPQTPYGYPPPHNYGYPPPGFPPQAATPVKPENQVDQLKAENERLRLNQQEERHAAQMKSLDEQHRQQMEALRVEIRNLSAAKPGDSDEVRLLREKLEREKEDRLRAEAKSAEDRHRAELEGIKASLVKPSGPDPTLLAMQAKMEADERRREEKDRLDDLRRTQERDSQILRDELRALRETPKGPDPVMLMVIEQLKSSNESQKEIARMNVERDREVARANGDALRELKTQMVHPVEMFRMVRDASSGQDQIITSTVSTLNSVFNTAQQWMNSVMQQMGGGGESPVYRLLEGGMAQVQDMAKRWMETKTQREVASAQAQRETAKAAQAQAQAFSAAHVPAWQAPPPVAGAGVQPVPGTNGSNGSGLNGAEAKPANGKAHPDGATHGPKLRKGGKTDEEWFGPALPDVVAMRTVAKQFQDSTLAKPPKLDANGHPEGLGPDQAAMFIMQAAGEIEKQGINILAFDKLFAEQMYPDLVEILLPDLLQGYRDDVLTFLWRLINGEPIEGAAAASASSNASA